LKSKSFKNKPIPYPIHIAFINMINPVIINNKTDTIFFNFSNFESV